MKKRIKKFFRFLRRNLLVINVVISILCLVNLILLNIQLQEAFDLLAGLGVFTLKLVLEIYSSTIGISF